ncbi:methionyl-tRNA formyltransferase [Pseudoalteromonas byunsanensis]|uniref:methionyl-tRNA formyltransferase n=1 Tax=Pseudoalteromonas byunsanensis TaxID=327939 RepID=UPI00158674A7|nr:formyltransferase family protein [Pseudoalteromonas byunsanensis]
MQKYAVFTGSCQSLPAIQYLLQSNKLGCVVLVDAEPNPDLAQLQYWLQQNNIQVVAYNQADDSRVLARLDELAINRALVYMFRHKLRDKLIQYFGGYLVNLHPSPLPEYRGPFPLYWQLRNGEEVTKLTIHRVTESIDDGDIAVDVDIEIHPFDTMNSLQQKVAQVVPYLIDTFCQLDEQQKLSWHKQAEHAHNSAPALTEQQLMVNWYQQTAKQVVNMARAGNVDSGCAIFAVGRDMFQLLQASIVECHLAGLQPGTVIEVDRHQGLLIKTKDAAVRFDVIGTQHGLFDGYRFAVLFGLEAGMSLSDI